MLLLSQIDHTKKVTEVSAFHGAMVIWYPCHCFQVWHYYYSVFLCSAKHHPPLPRQCIAYHHQHLWLLQSMSKVQDTLASMSLRRPSVFKDDAAASFSCRNLGMGRSKQGTLWPEPFFSTLWNWSPCNRQVMYEKWPQMHGRGSIALSKALWLTKL